MLFPRKCCFCMRSLDFAKTFDANSELICGDCYKQYEQIGWISGKTRLGNIDVRTDGLFALYEYRDGVKTAIRKLKFAHVKENGVLFGDLLNDRLRMFLKKTDYVIPIPISKRRDLERGYNQCEIIAHRMVKGTSAKVKTDVLFKNEKATRQSHKSGKERGSDAGKSFGVNTEVNLTGKTVVILDDILTTGNTLAVAVDLIREMGADKIYCVVFSIRLKMTDIYNKKNR